jgi:predicted nucleotidyltransferase
MGPVDREVMGLTATQGRADARALIAASDVELGEFCRHYYIRRLALFGSALRGQLRPESDLDLLVEFEPDARVGLLGISETQNTLSELLGRQVDLRTHAELSVYFRDGVLAETEPLCLS